MFSCVFSRNDSNLFCGQEEWQCLHISAFQTILFYSHTAKVIVSVEAKFNLSLFIQTCGGGFFRFLIRFKIIIHSNFGEARANLKSQHFIFIHNLTTKCEQRTLTYLNISFLNKFGEQLEQKNGLLRKFRVMKFLEFSLLPIKSKQKTQTLLEELVEEYCRLFGYSKWRIIKIQGKLENSEVPKI